MSGSWREALLSLPSETFLDLARIYLGKIHTPFNKQELADRLEALLRRPEVESRIASLLDREDAALLSAVLLMGDPEPEALLDFLLPAGSAALGGAPAGEEAGEGSPERTALLSRIVNLEERLLLYEYRDAAAGRQRLAVTPALRELVEEYAWEPSLLFPPASADSGPGARGMDPRLERAALVSFFLDPAHSPKADALGEPRLGAKLGRSFSEAFPSLGDGQSSLEALTRSRILRAKGERYLVDLESAARSLWLGDGAPDSAAAAYDRAAATAYLSAALAAHPDAGRTARIRLLMLGGGMDSGAAALLLSELGADGGEGGSGNCAVDADYSVHARPGLPPSDLFLLALCAELERLDGAAVFKLTRSSAARAFRAGLDAKTLAARLAAIGGRPLPQNVAYSLEAWEREHRSVTLVAGLVISCDERSARFMEASPLLKQRIRRELAPGIFLTDFADEAEAEDALSRAGLATPPALLSGIDRSGAWGGRYLEASVKAAPAADQASAAPAAAAPPPLPDLSRRRKAPPRSGEGILAEQAAALESLHPPRDLRDALEERIRLKLLVSDAGFEPGSVRYEKFEAGGLDYLGKVRLIERAIHEPSWLLEILFRRADGGPGTALVRARGLRKSAGGVRLEGESSGSPLSLPVERISRVRRIRTSIFSQ